MLDFNVSIIRPWFYRIVFSEYLEKNPEQTNLPNKSFLRAVFEIFGKALF